MSCQKCGKVAKMYVTENDNKVWCVSCGTRMSGDEEKIPLERLEIETLKKRMEEFGITQVKLAKMCDVTQSFMSRIVSGERYVPLKVRKKLAEVIGLNISNEDILRKEAIKHFDSLSFDGKNSVMSYMKYIKYCDSKGI
jgi:predicted transcriptional regulator|tara:strand:+ start:4528 stop:4944 length:417 start_codon:yes stop_codon:yes gene_type:complete